MISKDTVGLEECRLKREEGEEFFRNQKEGRVDSSVMTNMDLTLQIYLTMQYLSTMFLSVLDNSSL